MCPEGFIEILEGLAKICAPNPKLYTRPNGIYEPALAPVFYNPDMVENRDIAVGVVDYLINSLKTKFAVVDPLAATGVRGIRIALEVDKPDSIEVFIGDISELPVKLMKLNVQLNKLENRVVVEKTDANEYLYRLKRLGVRLSYIDIDPFGSPVPFTLSAISCIMNDGVVAFTATDLAVLEGKYREKMLRRYGVVGVSTEVSKEIAVRVLLSYIARTAFTLDRYIDPLLSYTYKHYVRVYIRIRRGATKADNQIKSCLRSLMICPYCGYSYIENGVDRQTISETVCPFCRSIMTKISPLWVCRTVDKEFIQSITNRLTVMPWIQRSTKTLLKRLQEYAEVDNITIRLTLLARVLRVNTPPRDRVVQCLNELGHKAVKSYVYGDGIVTTAMIDDVIYCVKN